MEEALFTALPEIPGAVIEGQGTCGDKRDFVTLFLSFSLFFLKILKEMLLKWTSSFTVTRSKIKTSKKMVKKKKKKKKRKNGKKKEKIK